MLPADFTLENMQKGVTDLSLRRRRTTEGQPFLKPDFIVGVNSESSQYLYPTCINININQNSFSQKDHVIDKTSKLKAHHFTLDIMLLPLS